MTRHTEGLREAYKLYQEVGGTLTSSEYRSIVKTYYSRSIDHIIYDNLELKLNHTGNIYIGKVKPKLTTWEAGIKPTLPIDWVNTKKHGKIIFHTNAKRFGYVFRIKWNKGGTKNISLFRFKPERWNFKRYLSNILQNEDIKIDAPLLS